MLWRILYLKSRNDPVLMGKFTSSPENPGSERPWKILRLNAGKISLQYGGRICTKCWNRPRRAQHNTEGFHKKER